VTVSATTIGRGWSLVHPVDHSDQLSWASRRLRFVSELIQNPGALVAYVLVACITPGPNNIAVTTAGVTKGHRAALATAAGVSVGWGIQVAICGIGLAAVIHAVPTLSRVVEGLAIAYLLWLVWKLWSADHIGSTGPVLGFWGAVLFQWVNPKAITLSLSLAALFVVHSGGVTQLFSALVVASAAGVLAFPCTSSWGLMGSSLSHRLSRPGAALYFNRAAGLALVGVVIWLLLD
jgi:threonine/homoserine/homoserine lactone efflux protein